MTAPTVGTAIRRVGQQFQSGGEYPRNRNLSQLFRWLIVVQHFRVAVHRKARGRSFPAVMCAMPHVAISAVAGAAGLSGAGLTTNPVLELAALSLAAAGIWGTLGPFWAMSSETLSGTGAAAGIALINSVGNLGGFGGPYLIGWVRTRTNNFTWGLVALALILLAGAVVTLAMKTEHKRLKEH